MPVFKKFRARLSYGSKKIGGYGLRGVIRGLTSYPDAGITRNNSVLVTAAVVGIT